MLVLDSAGLPELSVKSFLELPESIQIGKKKFKIGFITLHELGHFTSIHNVKGQWLYYDGKKLYEKLCPAEKTSEWENKVPVTTVYFAT
jgi:hypothetical protein